MFINEDGLFRINENIFNQNKQISSNKVQQKLSDIKEKIHNFHQFKCLNESICIFINNYVYVVSSEGNIIKKFIISDEIGKDYYVMIPFNIDLKELNTFNYIVLIVDSKGNLKFSFYQYNSQLNKNLMLFKDEIRLFDESGNEINLKEDFKCQLISNSLICFFSEAISNVLIIKKFEIDIDHKIIKLINNKKPEQNLNFAGKIINLFTNKNQSKILINLSSKENSVKTMKKYAIYNIMENKLEFLKEINDAINIHNIDTKSELELKSNMDYFESIDKYVLYSLNSRNELLVIELNEFFEFESKRQFVVQNKPGENSFEFINFYLINYNRNYQIVFIKKNNNINNNELNIICSNLIELFNNNYLRNLQGDGNDNPNSGGTGSNTGTNPGDNSGGNTGQNTGSNSGDNSGGNTGHNTGDNTGGNTGDNSGDNTGDNPGGNSGDNNEGNSKDNNGGEGGKGNAGGGNGFGERKGQTSGGFYFDFDNKNTTMPRNEIRENRNSIMENIQPGESYELRGDDFSIKVAPMGVKEEGKTSIDFKQCEDKLREAYGLSSDSVLSVFQTEVTSSNNKSLTNKVQYVVYDENNTQLNLSVCDNQKIEINYAIKNDSNFDFTKFSRFEDKGIDILNSSDPFFNDICYSYSDGDSDMILTDRINEIYQNYSLCDSGCEYQGLNSTSGTVSCSCPVSSDDSDSDDSDEAENIKEIILSLFSDSTFGVIKCYNLVFSSSKTSNIGFWVFLVIIIGHIPLYVWFFLKGNSQIKIYINKEMKRYHYLSQPKKEDNNDIKEVVNENNISNPPKNSNGSNERKKPGQSRNIPSDLNQKTENLKLAQNTAETEENDNNNNKEEINLNKILKKESNELPKNDKINMIMEANKTNDSTSKRDVNNNIITVYQTEETLGDKDNKSKPKLSEKESKSAYFLIQIDANNSPDNDKPLESNYILNNYEYETAIKFESRSFWRILYIVMISKDNILNTFILRSPLESKPLRICLLLFAYISDLALNTLFYFSDNISDKYHYTGSHLFWYTLFNNILISVISTILSMILGGILNMMADSRDGIEEEFKEEEKKLREDSKYKVSEERKIEILGTINKELKKLQVKMTFFVIIDFILLLFFFYFVTAFCEVYSNTQTSWISDAVVSIIISFPIELAIALAITIIYFLSIKYKWKYVYKLAMFLI